LNLAAPYPAVIELVAQEKANKQPDVGVIYSWRIHLEGLAPQNYSGSIRHSDENGWLPAAVVGAAELVDAHCGAHDYDDPGKPRIAWDDADARGRLVGALVSDAHRLLEQLPGQDPGSRAGQAVALLALIAGQDVEPVENSDGTDGRWRIAERVAPDRVISTVDPEARHVHKTVHRRQDGFKAHLAVEPDTGIITDCALTQANGADNHAAAVGLQLLGGEAEPVTVLADSAYGTGEFRAELAEHGHIDRVKPAPIPRIGPNGFTVDNFTVDHDNHTATCPNGLTRPISHTGVATFGVACANCPLRARCTRSRKGKQLKVGLHDARLRAARRAARDPNWLTDYRQHRPMIERTIAWLTRGNRRLRYRGTVKNDHWLHHRAAALNLRRLITLGLDHTGTKWAIA
jgi:IS5 family transposase